MSKKNNGNGNGNVLTLKQTKLTAKSEGQIEYIKSIQSNDITICIGPPGVGKTMIATAKAILALSRHEVGRIVITRPMVQAGEDTGFLPGELNDKLAPYVKPIYEEFRHYLETRDITHLAREGIIELCPFAVMRGLNFVNSFVVADECSNATKDQLKMLLTRFGEGTKLVINGDLGQSDLPRHQQGGLEYFIKVLRGMSGVGIVELHECDIVRHPIVARIIQAIRKYDQESKTQTNPNP